MIAGTRVRESWSNCKHCSALWDRKQQAQGSKTTEKHVEHDSCYHTSTASLGNSNRTHLPLKRLNSLNPFLLWKPCKLSLKIKTQHWIMMKHHFLDHTENSCSAPPELLLPYKLSLSVFMPNSLLSIMKAKPIFSAGLVLLFLVTWSRCKGFRNNSNNNNKIIIINNN